MSVLYHHIDVDNFQDYHVTADPALPDDVSFIDGVKIKAKLPNPLVFEVDFPSREDIPHFIADGIPVFSDYLVQILRAAGVDNFQVFPAVLRNPQVGEDWTGFWAFNAIGVVAAANLDKSEYDTIMEGDPDGVSVPLLGFTKIVLDKSKTHGLLMFRLAESPSTLVIHDRVNKYIDAHDPPDGWGFDAIKVEAV